MEKETIRVCFCTPEPDFGEVLGRALGEGFEIGFTVGHEVKTGCCNEKYDCVLLDLRDLPASMKHRLLNVILKNSGKTIFPLPSSFFWAMTIRWRRA